jgi:Flp pilus assembly protein TadD
MRIMTVVALLMLAVAPVGAVDPGGSSTDSAERDLATVRRLIDREDYAGAIVILDRLVVDEPDNADVHNLLGYSLRKTGETGVAEQHYLRALELEPLHVGANEYLGELYVETGALDKARERLGVLEQACRGRDCAEYRELAEAIGE